MGEGGVSTREERRDCAGGGVGGVDDAHGVTHVAKRGLDEGLEKRIVGATEQQDRGIGSLGEGFEEIDVQHLERDGDLRGIDEPAFFDERDEEGAGLFGGSETERVECSCVGT